MNKSKQKSTGPRSIPSVVQLPGGIALKAMPFRIVVYNDDGSPKVFELLPAGAPHDMTKSDACVLFAQEEWIRARQPDKVRVPKVLNEFEQAYIAEIEAAKGVKMLTCGEWGILEYEVDALRDGSMGLTGPQTVEERLERLRDHFP